ncbi:Neurogenic locus notch protein like protein [Chelonia mydas]|uniref:Neurogenic locus notch protein like protein n=1 Tax=Chelonia mydas TaxID=8469 RepID=M7BG85_CHEMY|nr:Neurogenic locus notch protein like protein [Chelonia mydas]
MQQLLVQSLLLSLLPALSRGLRCTQPVESCLNGGKCETYSNGTGVCLLMAQLLDIGPDPKAVEVNEKTAVANGSDP